MFHGVAFGVVEVFVQVSVDEAYVAADGVYVVFGQFRGPLLVRSHGGKFEKRKPQDESVVALRADLAFVAEDDQRRDDQERRSRDREHLSVLFHSEILLGHALAPARWDGIITNRLSPREERRSVRRVSARIASARAPFAGVLGRFPPTGLRAP